MRLTNTIRDAYVRSVMDDVPRVDYSEQIRELVTKAHIRALPREVRRAWEDPNQQNYINTVYRSYGGVSVGPLPGYGGSWNSNEHPVLMTPDQLELDALVAKMRAQEKSRDNLKAKLRSAAYAATTRKQLAELLPEFEKYLPADDTAALRTVPVVANLVADFVDAGWPKPTTPAAV